MMSFDDIAIFSKPTKLIDNLVLTMNNLWEKKTHKIQFNQIDCCLQLSVSLSLSTKSCWNCCLNVDVSKPDDDKIDESIDWLIDVSMTCFCSSTIFDSYSSFCSRKRRSASSFSRLNASSIVTSLQNNHNNNKSIFLREQIFYFFSISDRISTPCFSNNSCIALFQSVGSTNKNKYCRILLWKSRTTTRCLGFCVLFSCLFRI